MKPSLKNLTTETLKTKLSALQGTAKIDCLIELANRCMLYSEYQTGLDYARRAHDFAVESNATRHVADSLMQIGAFHLHKMNGLEAEKYYFQALELYRKANDSVGEANCQYKLGVYFWIHGANEKSIERFQTALASFQELAIKNEISACLTYVGRNLVELSKFEEALDYYFEALEITRTSKNSRQTIKLLNEIGNAFFELQRFDESLWYYEEALLLIEENPNKYLENDVLHRVGKTYFADKKYKEAAIWFEKNLTVAREINDHVSIERITNYLFRCQKSINKTKEIGRTETVQNLTFLNSTLPIFNAASFAKAC